MEVATVEAVAGAAIEPNKTSHGGPLWLDSV